MRKIVLEESVILALLTSPKAVKQLPFLKAFAAAAKKRPGCLPCQSGRATVDFSSIKKTVAKLDQASQVLLLNLLNADQLIVNYSSGGAARRLVITRGKQ